jgi:hypothetical protein
MGEVVDFLEVEALVVVVVVVGVEGGAGAEDSHSLALIDARFLVLFRTCPFNLRLLITLVISHLLECILKPKLRSPLLLLLMGLVFTVLAGIHLNI